MTVQSGFPFVLLLAAAATLVACGPSGPGPGEKAVADMEAALAAGHFGAVRRGLASVELGSLDSPALRQRAGALAMEVRLPLVAAELLARDARDDPAIRLMRVEALIRSGQFADAETALRKLEMKGHRNERWSVLKGMVEMGRGPAYWTEAEAHIKPLIEAGTADPDAWIYWAQFAHGRSAEVQRRLIQGMEKVAVPNQWPLRRAFGRHLLTTGQVVEPPAQQLEQVVRERPWDRDARLLLVRCRRRDSDRTRLDDAVREGESLVAEDPQDLEARVVLAEVLGEKGRVDPFRFATELQRAIELYELLLDPPPADTSLRIRYLQGLARAHIELIQTDSKEGADGQHFQAAKALLRDAIDLDPQGTLMGRPTIALTAESKYQLARAHRWAKVKDDTLAIGLFEEACVMSPRLHEAHWALAHLYHDYLEDQGKFGELAVVHADQYLRILQEDGLPAPDVEKMAIIAKIRQLVKEGRKYREEDDTPDAPE